MTKYLTPYFVILSCLTHLLCCGIPFFLSVTSLGSTLGLSTLYVVDFPWFEEIEIYLFTITSIVVVLSIISEVNSRRLDCITDGLCEHTPCNPKKKLIKVNLYVALFLYLINFIVFYLEHS